MRGKVFTIMNSGTGQAGSSRRGWARRRPVTAAVGAEAGGIWPGGGRSVLAAAGQAAEQPDEELPDPARGRAQDDPHQPDRLGLPVLARGGTGSPGTRGYHAPGARGSPTLYGRGSSSSTRGSPRTRGSPGSPRTHRTPGFPGTCGTRGTRRSPGYPATPRTCGRGGFAGPGGTRGFRRALPGGREDVSFEVA